jgi:hypothetical protein
VKQLSRLSSALETSRSRVGVCASSHFLHFLLLSPLRQRPMPLLGNFVQLEFCRAAEEQPRPLHPARRQHGSRPSCRHSRHHEPNGRRSPSGDASHFSRWCARRLNLRDERGSLSTDAPSTISTDPGPSVKVRAHADRDPPRRDVPRSIVPTRLRRVCAATDSTSLPLSLPSGPPAARTASQPPATFR